jgi:pilus assembly protein Flp/PilA
MNNLGPDKAPSACSAEIEDAWRYPKEAVTLALRDLLHDDSGQDLIEYALVAALVALGAVAAMRGLKNSIGNSFNAVGNSLTNAVA